MASFHNLFQKSLPDSTTAAAFAACALSGSLIGIKFNSSFTSTVRDMLNDGDTTGLRDFESKVVTPTVILLHERVADLTEQVTNCVEADKTKELEAKLQKNHNRFLRLLDTNCNFFEEGLCELGLRGDAALSNVNKRLKLVEEKQRQESEALVASKLAQALAQANHEVGEAYNIYLSKRLALEALGGKHDPLEGPYAHK